MDETEIATLLQAAAGSYPDGTFLIEVTGGPGAPARLELDGSSPSRVLVGSSPSCDLRLADPELSRRHCALEVVGTRLRVTDLGSTNGTFVNDVQVNEALIRDSATLSVGGTTLRVTYQPSGHNRAVPAAESFGRVLGQSRAMRRLYPLAQKLAQSNVPVVIEGETGTGKEALAESIHEVGPLAQGPFVVFDCTAVAPSLVEAELFGFERGAFTGAIATRRGVFEQAHGGTLLIDEIGDLDLPLQPKLLRVLERGEVRRIGGAHPIKVDVRILSATRRDLDREVQAGRFRDDLYHRLAVTRIELPPLRERDGDVTFLARRFWTALGGAGTPPAEWLARWEAHTWPGNVRELRNAVARTLALGEDAATTAGPPSRPTPGADFIDAVVAEGLALQAARLKVIAELEQRYIERILAVHGGNVTHAAQASGIARRQFQRLKAKARD